MRPIIALVLFGAIVSAGGFVMAFGQLKKCNGCGNECVCRKVCHLVCEDKKVTVTMWAGKCEEKCLHGPGVPICDHCEMIGGDTKDPDVPCAKPKKFTWTNWSPIRGAEMITTNKLMKRTVTKNVPTYKWVVEDLCPDCAINVATRKEEKQER